MRDRGKGGRGSQSRAKTKRRRRAGSCVAPFEMPSVFEESPSVTVSRRLENDSLSCCSGKPGAKREWGVCQTTVKKAMMLDEWLGMLLSNQTG